LDSFKEIIETSETLKISETLEISKHKKAVPIGTAFFLLKI